MARLPAFIDPKKDRGDGGRQHRATQGLRVLYRSQAEGRGVYEIAIRRVASARSILLPPTKGRLNVVGRLDAESSGLLLMTNDGELAEQITHPRLEIPKVYRAEVRGQTPREIVGLLKKGVHLSEGKAQASSVEIVRRTREMSVLNITLCEGRNRQVRRMLARLDFPVKTLKRVQIGSLSLKGLPVGACRRLSPRELSALRRVVLEAEKRLELRQASGATVRRRKRSGGRSGGGVSKPAPVQKPRPKADDPKAPGSRRRRLIT